MRTKRLLLTLTVMLLPLFASAETVEIDGIFYKLNYIAGGDSYAEVTYDPESVDFPESGGVTNTTYSGNVVIPSTIEYQDVIYNVISIGDLAFSGCRNLESVTIPQTVTDVKYSAFSGGNVQAKISVSDYAAFCRNKIVRILIGTFDYFRTIVLVDTKGNEITDFVIPHGVASIEDFSFARCVGLTSVTFPETVTSIGEDAFAGCGKFDIKVSVSDFAYFFSNADMRMISTINRTSHHITLTDTEGEEIRDIIIPDGVTSINDYAFSGCGSFNSITIPETVNHISWHEITNATEINCYAVEPPSVVYYSDPVSPNYSVVTLRVPETSIEQYKAKFPWNIIENIVPLVKEIPVEDTKCPTPRIRFVNGEVVFSCEADDVTYHYSIKLIDSKSGEGNNIKLANTYRISVYASKEGYEDSEVTIKDIELPLGGNPCDANGDGVVNAADVVTVTNCIMGGKE